MSQRVVSLFSGIAGFELGLAGEPFEVVLQCDLDPAANAVLAKWRPEVERHNDITSLSSLPSCEVIVGGWPCQDLSQAGKLAGLHGRQSSLVQHVFRLIDAASRKPKTVVLENVAFALAHKRGEAIAYVTKELELRGYRWAYRVLDTQQFGLPQRRRRVYIVASREIDPVAVLLSDLQPQKSVACRPRMVGFYWTEGNRGIGWTPHAVPPLKGGSAFSIPSPPAIWNVASGHFLTPGIEDAERLQGFPSGWTSPAADVAKSNVRWRLIGNAVSVPVARWLGRRMAAPPARELPAGVPVCRGSAHNAGYGGPPEDATYIAGAPEGPEETVSRTLAQFRLAKPRPLSLRAAQGFLQRYERSSLKKNDQFYRALSDYVTNLNSPAAFDTAVSTE
jgi:DNA (cytosine-5)-methyltransferase 1